MAEIDKGTCGECFFYSFHKFTSEGIEIGNCSSPLVPLHETLPTYTPRQALMVGGEKTEHKVEYFLTRNETCFTPLKS